MDKFNDWIHLDMVKDKSGLQVWCKIDTVDDSNYLKVQYRNNNGEVVTPTQGYPTEQISFLYNLIQLYNYKVKYPHIDLNISIR